MWEFPKGKRESKESDIECALREFTEESRISDSMVRILDPFPIYIRFVGTDGRVYENYYYIADSAGMITFPEPLQMHGRIRTSAHSGEASKIAWMDVREAPQYMSDHNINVLELAIKIRNQRLRSRSSASDTISDAPAYMETE
jgi:8-oxo-dGTP pyrophosphatase MutT (NUDIX family)